MAKYQTTPAGKARYPRLTHPDTKFNADGEYKCDLILEGEAAQALKAKIDKLTVEVQKEALANGKKKAIIKKNTNYPYEAVLDDDENETGEFIFKFKLKAKGKTRAGKEFTQKPKLFDAGGKIIKNPPSIYGGSTIRISFDPFQYGADGGTGVGVSLRLKAAQIIELVEGGASADSFGFGAEEGYEADDTDFEDTNEEAGEADDSGDDEDF